LHFRAEGFSIGSSLPFSSLKYLEYLDHLREDALSDHSALELDFELAT